MSRASCTLPVSLARSVETLHEKNTLAAAMGEIGAAPAQFEAARDVPRGGVLLALPALLATGLLRFTNQIYTLPQGYYGIDSIFLLLALMALARIPSMEQLRNVAPSTGFLQPLTRQISRL